MVCPESENALSEFLDMVRDREAQFDTSHQRRAEEQAEGACWLRNVDEIYDEDDRDDEKSISVEAIGFLPIAHFEIVCLA